MTPMTVEQAMQIALEHHASGRLSEAEGIYRQVLAQCPDHVEALHCLGIVAGQMSNTDAAIDLIGRAVALQPGHAEAHNNLGAALYRAGRLAEAIAALGRAIALQPDHVEAHNNLGAALFEVGSQSESIAAYRRALALNPDHAEAHYNLGIALFEADRPTEAIAAYGRALALKPDHAAAENNLGIALFETDRTAEAISAYGRAIALKPDYAEAHTNLGAALFAMGRVDEAIDAYTRAIEKHAGYAQAHNNLGVALFRTDRPAEAIAAYGRALALKPDHAETENNLGIALFEADRPAEAISAYGRALALKPDYAEAHMNLGAAFYETGRVDEAIDAYTRAIEKHAGYAQAYNNLGVALSKMDRPAEAIAALGRAMALAPGYADPHSNLGHVLTGQGCLDEALGCFRRAVALKDDYAEAASNFLFTLHYHPEFDAQAILAEHRRWAEQFAAPLAGEIRPHCHDRTPDRKLRIGFVSPDFRGHPVGWLVRPLFTNRDVRQFEFFAYSDVRAVDEVSREIKALADGWLSVVGMSDSRVADRIRDDRIDILVDLALHTAQNRMRVFARKPAPVQVTMLGLPATTGLTTIDYRLTDPYLDPPGATDADYSEQSIRLPHCFWIFEPPEEAPPVSALPALKNGFVTFGCLNQFAKVSGPALQLWLKILQCVPDARLVIRSQPGSHRDRVRAQFRAGGVSADRVEFTGNVPRLEYFRSYDELDVCLDPFPYNGHTTTLDALWMGVPVIALSGRTCVGRGGVSILSNVGLPELIAGTPEEYVAIAAGLAGDRARLNKLRAGLRVRMECSPLVDVRGYAADVEAAFRRMWTTWCES